MARVQVAGGLVGQQQARPADQRAGDGDALLLAARELVGQVVQPLAQPDLLEHLAGKGARLAPLRD